MKFDAVIIGGGAAGAAVARILEEAGFSVAIFSKGQSLNRPDLQGLNGPIFKSDRVVSADFKNGRIAAVHSENFGKTPIEASWFLLSTGKFLSGGLAADMNGIRETFLGLDCSFDPDRNNWTEEDFYAPQSFMKFGVTVDDKCRCSRNGKLIENLFAAGEVVCGEEDVENSAIRAAHSIIDARS